MRINNIDERKIVTLKRKGEKPFTLVAPAWIKKALDADNELVEHEKEYRIAVDAGEDRDFITWLTQCTGWDLVPAADFVVVLY